MNTISANEAKTHFGDLLLNAQKSPVQISKNGKPVAVVISVDEYESIEAMKLYLLQNKAAQAMKDISKRDLVAGEAFFNELEEGLYD
ncbi:type II toxin-antitoxin system Phd/YefM family antitoxin [Marinomonas rhizomae]|uniref:type II toxin-antitoxin system Phd/YefM family antitoxin n=1 Tax=Marinomonas TaxID=28253 RepID=UPI0021037D96|nr:type II toxin-antitoxin system Phd/YefM family antitoxin [Marinomonas rhizomae]UTV98741.1 type II toxin-antitoxin system Phd/YefM family antitoxin [Marinomonas rhizomae]